MSYTFKQHLNRRYVSSTIICFYEYEKDTGNLKIGFNDGVVAFFKKVPRGIVQQFETSESKGRFFFRHFRDAGYKFHLEPN